MYSGDKFMSWIWEEKGALWEIPGLWLSDHVCEIPLVVILEFAKVAMNQGGDA